MSPLLDPPFAAVATRTPSTQLARSVLWGCIVAPPLFLLVAVQHGAVTHPFWDYCRLIPYFDQLHNGTLSFSDLFVAHNQNRPATWRVLILANAWLTGWDIRSEYVYLMIALIGAFLMQVLLLRRCCASCSHLRQLALVALLSIVSFSPTAHNNHWWSMLIQFDMGHLFIVTAFTLVAWRENQWRDHVLAALVCWLATYTVTNGLVAFVACAVVAQVFFPTPQRVHRLTLFWAANIALVLVLYVPGLPDIHRGLPWPGRWLAFTLAYIGSPAAGLIWFPFDSQFDLPHATSVTARNAVAGFILVAMLASKGYSLIRARERSPAARAFSAFALFALGSAVLTGLGRAQFGEDGVANANASRFVLFGSYALYACLYDATRVAASRSAIDSGSNVRALPTVAGLLLLGCATVTYARSWKVYGQARHFDQLLEMAYATVPKESPFDHLIYPFREEIPGYKATLRRLRVGPYRDAPDDHTLQRLAKTKLVDEFGISGLRAGNDGLILFAHPHSRFSIDVSRAVAIHFRYGVLPNAVTAIPPTDGVEFRVLVRDASSEGVLWSSIWRPVPGTPSEQQVTVALPGTDFSGTLIFETLTAGRYENDWAYWADLVMSESR